MKVVIDISENELYLLDSIYCELSQISRVEYHYTYINNKEEKLKSCMALIDKIRRKAWKKYKKKEK